MEPATIMGLVGVGLGFLVTHLSYRTRLREADSLVQTAAEQMKLAQGAQYHAQRNAGKLSNIIHRQRLEIRKLNEQYPKPKRTKEQWEALKAAKNVQHIQ